MRDGLEYNKNAYGILCQEGGGSWRKMSDVEKPTCHAQGFLLIKCLISVYLNKLCHYQHHPISLKHGLPLNWNSLIQYGNLG